MSNEKYEIVEIGIKLQNPKLKAEFIFVRDLETSIHYLVFIHKNEYLNDAELLEDFMRYKINKCMKLSVVSSGSVVRTRKGNVRIKFRLPPLHKIGVRGDVSAIVHESEKLFCKIVSKLSVFHRYKVLSEKVYLVMDRGQADNWLKSFQARNQVRYYDFISWENPREYKSYDGLRTDDESLFLLENRRQLKDDQKYFQSILTDNGPQEFSLETKSGVSIDFNQKDKILRVYGRSSFFWKKSPEDVLAVLCSIPFFDEYVIEAYDRVDQIGKIGPTVLVKPVVRVCRRELRNAELREDSSGKIVIIENVSDGKLEVVFSDDSQEYHLDAILNYMKVHKMSEKDFRVISCAYYSDGYKNKRYLYKYNIGWRTTYCHDVLVRMFVRNGYECRFNVIDNLHYSGY